MHITQEEDRLDWEKKCMNFKWHSYAELNCTQVASSLHSVVTGLLILKSFYIIPHEQSNTATLGLRPPFKSEGRYQEGWDISKPHALQKVIAVTMERWNTYSTKGSYCNKGSMF